MLTHRFAKNDEGKLLSRMETDVMQEARDAMNAGKFRAALEAIIQAEAEGNDSGKRLAECAKAALDKALPGALLDVQLCERWNMKPQTKAKIIITGFILTFAAGVAAGVFAGEMHQAGEDHKAAIESYCGRYDGESGEFQWLRLVTDKKKLTQAAREVSAQAIISNHLPATALRRK